MIEIISHNNNWYTWVRVTEEIGFPSYQKIWMGSTIYERPIAFEEEYSNCKGGCVNTIWCIWSLRWWDTRTTKLFVMQLRMASLRLMLYVLSCLGVWLYVARIAVLKSESRWLMVTIFAERGSKRVLEGRLLSVHCWAQDFVPHRKNWSWTEHLTKTYWMLVRVIRKRFNQRLDWRTVRYRAMSGSRWPRECFWHVSMFRNVCMGLLITP